ncbi:hypothetical protein [Aestuariispira insulae]|uniref:DUF676 domain-containing protein n=1 Tax=Aestuariispira insulae TaxID=1461337 RepID=A0A3D9HHY2_9PROT|nr:hypothetical protein [Aestuariispira insulae]RED49080.1 hypothetical protein DFP90_10657 [Aestuariispira insulae]
MCHREKSRYRVMLGLWALLTVGMVSQSGTDVAQADEADLNLPFPTLGGKQVWTDRYYRQGWRIQENVLTGHARLLDPDDTRRAWGSYDHCLQMFQLRYREKAGQPDRHLVIMLHGILRSGGSFSSLASRLEAEGYAVAGLSYASTRLTLEQHGANLNSLMDQLEDVSSVSFVTHSMGALVLRQALGDKPTWTDRIEILRAVMIAPPNRGSALAQDVQALPAYRAVYGRPGLQLTPEAAQLIPMPPRVPFAVIAGGRNDGEGYNPFLEGDDDGVVRVVETRLSGMADFLVLPALHSTILSDPRTGDAVLAFFAEGRFSQAEAEE